MKNESYSHFDDPSDLHFLLLHIPPFLLDQIDHLAVDTGLSRSEIIRSCLLYSLDHLEIVDPER